MRFKEFINESKESREAMKRMNLKYMGYGFYRGNGNTYKWNPQLKRMEQSSSKDYLDRADFQDYRKTARSTFDQFIKMFDANLSKKDYNEKLKKVTWGMVRDAKKLELDRKSEEKEIYVSKEDKENIGKETFISKQPIIAAEINSLKYYSNHGYEAINKYLRSGHIQDVDEEILKRKINFIDDTIKRNQTKEEGIVYRIVERGDFLNKDKFQEKAFLSTSLDKNYLEEQNENYDEPVIITIKVPKGINFTQTKFHDDFESEILFERNLTLKKLKENYYEIEK